MCGRVCSLSRVKDGRERCGACHARLVVWGAAGLLVAYAGVWPRVFLALRAAIGVVWVRACPPFFCLSRVSGVFSGERGGALGFGLSCFCVRSVVDYGCEVAM